MNTNQPIKELFRKYIDNSISREEYEMLLHYFGSSIEEEVMNEHIIGVLKVETKNNSVDQVRLSKAVRNVDRGLQERLFSVQ